MTRRAEGKNAVLRLVCFFFFLMGSHLRAQETTVFSEDRLDAFYDEFVCEEKDITATVGITGPCVATSNPSTACGTLASRPTIAPLAAQVPSTCGSSTCPSGSPNHIPVVLVNNTGLADSEVFFVLYGFEMGAACAAGSATFVSFGAQPGAVNTCGATSIPATAANTPTTETYSYAFSDVPLTNGQRIIYVPYLVSGNMLFSVRSKLTGLVTGAGTIAVPVASDPSDPNYLKVYGGLELTFQSCQNQLTLDFTCVDFYGLSIYLNLFTQNPLPTIPQNRPSGIYQSRAYTLCSFQHAFAQATPAALSQWNDLILRDGSTVLRVLSPGYAMSHTGGTFDTSYFDNAAAYGFSWADYVWKGTSAYYRTYPLIVVTVDGTQYNGKVIDSGGTPYFVFKSTSSTETFRIPWSNAPIAPSSFSASTSIFNVANFFNGMQYSSDGVNFCVAGTGGCLSTVGLCHDPTTSSCHATQITEYLSASIAAGLIPGKVSKLTSSGFPPSVINSYYTNNANLSTQGQSTGPWYDLYSVGLHANEHVTGNAVYSYAYDDYLYNQAPVSGQVAPSQATVDCTTYVTIILGPYSDN